MFSKLDDIEHRYEEVVRLISDPKTISDQERYVSLTKEHADLEPIVEEFRRYRDVMRQIDDNKTLLDDNDNDIVVMAKEELARLESEKDEC